MFPVVCIKEMYIEYKCNVIFVVMSLRHCKLSSHNHYKNHITSVFYIHFFITISYLCDAMSHLSHGGRERSSADASGCYDEAVGKKTFID